MAEMYCHGNTCITNNYIITFTSINNCSIITQVYHIAEKLLSFNNRSMTTQAMYHIAEKLLSFNNYITSVFH